MSSFIGKKPCLLLSATCDGILSWMIEIWMKIYLVSKSSCNTATLRLSKKFTRNDKQCWVKHLVLVTLYRGLQSILSKTIRIGDTQYPI